LSVKDHWDAIIAGVAAIAASFWNNRKIEAVRHGVNGALAELLKVTKSAAYGQGQQREREDQAKREEGKDNNGRTL
jgi:hypothetical protein